MLANLAPAMGSLRKQTGSKPTRTSKSTHSRHHRRRRSAHSRH